MQSLHARNGIAATSCNYLFVCACVHNTIATSHIVSYSTLTKQSLEKLDSAQSKEGPGDWILDWPLGLEGCWRNPEQQLVKHHPQLLLGPVISR